MARVASLLVQLQADISQFETAMRNATSAIEKVGKSMQKIGKGMTKYITTPIMGIIGAGLKFNASLEDATLNFETLLGSAEDAKKMIEGIQSIREVAPVMDMGTLTKGAQELLSYGISAEKIIPTLKMLGDASLGNKSKFEGLVTAYAQVQSAGKLTGQELRQLINAGFNPLQVIAEETGQSISELEEKIDEGLVIPAEAVTAAFVSATSEGGRFFNGMVNASSGFSGRLKALKNSLIELAKEFSNPIFDSLKEKMASLTEKINSVIEWFRNLDDGTKKQIATFFLIVSAIGPVLLVLGKLLSAFSVFPKALGIVKTAFGGLSKVFSLIAAHPIVAIILGIIAVLIYLYNTNENVRNAIQNAWESFKTFLSNLIQFIKTVFGFLVDFLAPVIEGAIEQLRNAWDSIVVIITAIVEIFAELFRFLGALFKGDWGAMWEHAKNILKKAVGAIIVVVINLVDTMLIAFQKLSEILLDKVFTGIAKGFQAMVNGLLKGWNWLADKFGWKKVDLLDLDIESYVPSKLIQKVRDELSELAEKWRGGEKAELPFSSGKSKDEKPDVPTIPELEEMPDLSAFDDLDMTFSNIGETAEKAADGVDKLRDSVKSLVDSIRQQTNAFKNALSLFEKFERKAISPQRLLNRLKAQVKAMTDWTNALTTLQARGVSEAFLNELRMMGPSEVDYVRALAQMTDEQLAQYQQFYRQKYDIAQKEAERAVMTEQKINNYIEKKIDIHISGNTISNQNDVKRIADEIIRELKLRGI